MERVLNSGVKKVQKEFFKQILGIVMGTNLLAPILANTYLAMLEQELIIICKNNKHQMACNV